MDIFRNVSQPVGDQIRNYINENPHIVDESAESNNDWTLANILPLVGIAGGLFKVPTHGQDLKLRAAREEFTRRFGKDWAPIDELRQVNKRRQDTARGFENLSKKACYHDYKLEQLVCEASYFGDDLDACLDQADSNYENCKNNGGFGGIGIPTFEELNGQSKRKGNPDKSMHGKPKRDSLEYQPGEMTLASIPFSAPLMYMYLKAVAERAPSDQPSQSSSLNRFLKQIVVQPGDAPYGTPANAAPYLPPPWLLPMLLGGG